MAKTNKAAEDYIATFEAKVTAMESGGIAPTEAEIIQYIKARVNVRVPTSNKEEALTLEYIRTTLDRIKMRINEKPYPIELASIAVEVVVICFNQQDHEGTKSDKDDTFSISIVNDVLGLYQDDLDAYVANKEGQSDAGRAKVRFL